jgi:hypothetical protein
MKSAVIWDVAPCGSYKDRRFERKHRLHCQGDENRRDRKISKSYQPKHTALLLTANVVPTLPILANLIVEVVRSL